ncbi:MAG: hypothetical protein IJ828_02665 [Treponema sp.]|nr:hypothetical protein [Treponema sp.]
MHISKKTAVLLTMTAAASSLFLSSCKKKTEANEKTYTYRVTSTAPSTWSPTDYQMGCESTILSLTADSLYSYVLNDTKDGHVTECCMASEFPIDVTSEYAGNPVYGIPQDADKGYAWKFNLRDDLVWEDGTPITADTFEYSLKQFLNPQMKNYRASAYYADTLVIANAEQYYEGNADWQKVGFVKNSDHSYTLVLSTPMTDFMIVMYGSINLVKEDLYEANKKESGNIIKSAYGTDIDKYASYGPYKIAEYQADKYIKLEKNENWFGYKAFKDKNYYQTTHVYIQFILEHATTLNMFLQGKLDEVGLSSVDMDKYGNSEYRIITPETYTAKMSFNIDKKSLKNEESEGINHSIISYKDFRHAVSLSINREKFVSTVAIGSDPAYGLYSNAYIVDPYRNERYRETPQAQESLCEFYGTERFADITGYNKDEAKRYFQKAYDEAVKNGDLKSSDKVQIDLHITTDNEGIKRMVAFLQESINNATQGTDLENKVTIKFIVDENYYANMKQGKVDLAITLWGGAPYAIYKMLACYCDPDVKNEYGFDPVTEKCTLTVEGKDVTLSFYDWYKEVGNGKYAIADIETKNAIVAGVEKALLSYYNMIPLYYMNSNSMISQRIIYGADHYINPLVEYGGIQEMTYSMDDEEWEKYCKKNSYQLKY